MKRLFADMDLYKFIILSSIVFIPAAIAFVWWTDQQVQVARKAITAATRTNGDLFKIGELQKKLKDLKSNKVRGQQNLGDRVYFRNQIIKNADDTLTPTQLDITPRAAKVVPGMRNAEDIEVDIAFNDKDGKKTFPLPRRFIHMVVHNCEVGSKVWKLRRLQMTNAEVPRQRKNAAPPRTTDRDEWQIRQLTFVRRQPKKKR